VQGLDVRTSGLAGLALGLIVGLWMVVATVASLQPIFPLVATALQLVVLVGALARMRAEHGFAQQLAAGMIVSVVASVLIFGESLLLTTVLFPDALAAMRAEVAASMPDASPAELEAATAMVAPVPQAVMGVVGTLVTGLVLSAIAGAFLRRDSSS